MSSYAERKDGKETIADRLRSSCATEDHSKLMETAAFEIERLQRIIANAGEIETAAYKAGFDAALSVQAQPVEAGEPCVICGQLHCDVCPAPAPPPVQVPVVKEGWKLVPIEPTREMWAAMADSLYGYKNRHHDKVAGDLYRAMLAAAPLHASPEQGETTDV